MKKINILLYIIILCGLFITCKQENKLPAPKSIIINSVSISDIPSVSSSNRKWDNDGFPDLYLEFHTGNETVSTDTIQNTDKTTNVKLFFKKPLKITEIDKFYWWYLNDWDNDSIFKVDDEVLSNQLNFNNRYSNSKEQTTSYGAYKVTFNVVFEF